MNHFYCDASALIKRYLVENGSPLMNQLIEETDAPRLHLSILGAGEILSAIVRQHNRGQLSPAGYRAALAAFRQELLVQAALALAPVPNSLVFTSLPLIQQHHINATDAIVLRSALDIHEELRRAGHSVVLVASDLRLVRGGSAEGLTVFNPETDPMAQLEALIAG